MLFSRVRIVRVQHVFNVLLSIIHFRLTYMNDYISIEHTTIKPTKRSISIHPPPLADCELVYARKMFLWVRARISRAFSCVYSSSIHPFNICTGKTAAAAVAAATRLLAGKIGTSVHSKLVADTAPFSTIGSLRGFASAPSARSQLGIHSVCACVLPVCEC